MKHWHLIPPEVYALVESTPATVLLESAESDPSNCAHSRFFTAPQRVLVAYQLSEVADLLAQIESAVATGCFVAGYFAYESGGFFEPKASQRPIFPGQPLAWLGIYDRCYLFDHPLGAFVGDDPPGLAAARQQQETEPSVAVESALSLEEEQYSEAIAAIHQWIRSGDIYQLNFTHPLRIATLAQPAKLYQSLRLRQPAQYGALLHTQANRRVLCFSPELFFRIEGTAPSRRITTRPMKGTAARGRTTVEDRAQAQWLANDLKNRAENLMIVDLVRNDLGRICNFGSVHVQSLFAVERYPTLWQMTSTITGELRPEIDFRQIFRALFPCGSITGAPKLRAMQLIAEIEPEPRGIYTGAIGFFSPEQTVFNVAIRTLELVGSQGTQQGSMGIGSGIVIDSIAKDEFRECRLKSNFLTDSCDSIPSHFSLVETLLWQGDFPFLELHLDRLADSAEYFSFACDREEVAASLQAHTASFADPHPRKLRLLLARDSDLSITDEILSSGTPNSELRLTISGQHPDPGDAFLYHKTTHRPLYAKAFQAAQNAGFDDAIFLNSQGEVTESAIANLFIEKDGRWFTPPIACGLLAGVYRRHLLATRHNLEEKTLRVEELLRADAIYLANAVRGLRRARLIRNLA